MMPDLLEQRLAEAGAHLSAWLVARAISGIGPLASAGALAAGYRSDLSFRHDEARIDALVRWEASKSFTAGFLATLGGALTLPAALPSQLGAAWLLQARMVAAIADLRGHRLDDPATQSLVLISLLGAAAPEVLRAAGVRGSRVATRALLGRLSEEALLRVNRRAGFGLLQAGSRRGFLRAGRLVPLVGASVGGAIDAYACRRAARAARRLFPPPRLLGPAAAEGRPLRRG